MVQSGNNGWAPILQEEDHHHSERKVGDPSSRNVTGDVVSSGPAAHGEHQGTHTWVQLSIQVEQFCALHCHPVGNKRKSCYCYTVIITCITEICITFSFSIFLSLLVSESSLIITSHTLHSLLKPFTDHQW